MASAFQEQCCSICELQHLTNIADEWCPECDEYLCSNCKTHHKLAKSSRKHTTVEMSDLKELPTFVSAIKLECDTHHENYEYFCPKHEIPICVICAREHTSCGSFTILRKLEGTKVSPSMIKLEQNVKDIQQNLEIFLQNRQSNLSNLKDQEVGCKEKIKELRLKINQHLDKLENTVIGEIDTLYTKHKSEVEQSVDDLSTRKEKINTIQNNIHKVKDHASEIQMFLSIQSIQKDVKEEENQLVTIGKEILREIELSILPASTGLTGIKAFGELKTNTKPADICFVRQDDVEAQLVIPEAHSKDIDEISLTKKLHIPFPTHLGKTSIQGCCCTDEGIILLADQGEKSGVLVFKSNGALERKIPLLEKPNDVVYYNKTVFVSSYSAWTLTSVDFDTRKVKKKIKLSQMCNALAVAGDKIVLHLYNLEYKIYDLNLVEVSKIPIRMTHAPHLSYFDEKIYIAEWIKNTVYCYNIEGTLLWKFKEEDIKGPHGTTIDSYGNVFVCGFYSDSISVISPNGKHSRNLLKLTDVLTNPTAIHYNHVLKQLIVCSNAHNTILVYDV